MKTVKKHASLIILLLTTSLIFGQPGPEKKGSKPSKEKVKAMKVGYITDKLDLTSEEAQQFWPIYNEFEAKMEESHKAMRQAFKKEAGIDELTDAEVEAMINNINDIRQKELDLQKEYHLKFKAVLPIKKVAKLYKANQDFKRDLLRKIKNHDGKGPRDHPGPPPRD